MKYSKCLQTSNADQWSTVGDRCLVKRVNMHMRMYVCMQAATAQQRVGYMAPPSAIFTPFATPRHTCRGIRGIVLHCKESFEWIFSLKTHARVCVCALAAIRGTGSRCVVPNMAAIIYIRLYVCMNVCMSVATVNTVVPTCARRRMGEWWSVWEMVLFGNWCKYLLCTYICTWSILRWFTILFQPKMHTFVLFIRKFVWTEAAIWQFVLNTIYLV